MIITLDGPAGSGKSSTARKLAQKLGGVYLDTGAMYRSVTLVALETGKNPADEAECEAIARAIGVDFSEAPDGQKVFINGRDRTPDIRTPEVDRAVSAVSAHKGVRDKMVALQRDLARHHATVIVEGRDAGSVVFPNADHKFFISADPRLRAERRAAQMGDMEGCGIETIVNDIVMRDEKDSSRANSPLVIPPGAVVIDNSNLNLDETVRKIIELLA